MKANRQYFTLIASLPYLPRFDQAARLPINRERLEERLRILPVDDLDILQKAEAYLTWNQHPISRTDEEFVAYLDHLKSVIKLPTLIDMIDFRVDQRTVMVALRRRKRGLALSGKGKVWGAGRWVKHIERNWDHPDFRLKALFPWIPAAQKFLDQEQVIELERFVLFQIWHYLDRNTWGSMFGLESVLAYLFKWDILKRWLAYNAAQAQLSFQHLVAEVNPEYDQPFSS